MTDGLLSATDKSNKRYRSYYHKNKEHVLAKNIKWANENFEKYTFNRVKQRAGRQGTTFLLELSDISIPTHCPLLGTPLIKQIGLDLEDVNVVSVDRIDNSQGYIKGNIQILSVKANRMKNNASPQELKTFCENYLKYVKSKTDMGNPERGGPSSVHGTGEQPSQPGQPLYGPWSNTLPR